MFIKLTITLLIVIIISLRNFPIKAEICTNSQYINETANTSDHLSVKNYAWASYTVQLWANHIDINTPEDILCDASDPDPDCKNPLGRGYPIGSSYLNLNQSHTFDIDRSGLYVGDEVPIPAEFTVTDPSESDCSKTTWIDSFIYISSEDSFEECVGQTHKRYLRQYFFLNGYYPGYIALNNFSDFKIYNDIESHGTVFNTCWKIN